MTFLVAPWFSRTLSFSSLHYPRDTSNNFSKESFLVVGLLYDLNNYTEIYSVFASHEILKSIDIILCVETSLNTIQFYVFLT